MDKHKVLDACCGSRMFWFDKKNPLAIFCDNREMETQAIWTSGDGKATLYCEVRPDIKCDVRDLPFEDESFYHIVLDPPHLLRLGDTSWLAKKYGTLKGIDWKEFIHDAFVECWRVLKPNGTLIFKWNETDIPLKEILKLIPVSPLYGHRSGKNLKTHWMAFFKDGDNG